VQYQALQGFCRETFPNLNRKIRMYSAAMLKLSLDAIEIIDAIDRGGSFAAAAEALHKVPSTISYTVAKLEEQLGFDLVRTSRAARQPDPGRPRTADRGPLAAAFGGRPRIAPAPHRHRLRIRTAPGA
jgi:hypothetical protein